MHFFIIDYVKLPHDLEANLQSSLHVIHNCSNGLSSIVKIHCHRFVEVTWSIFSPYPSEHFHSCCLTPYLIHATLCHLLFVIRLCFCLSFSWVFCFPELANKFPMLHHISGENVKKVYNCYKLLRSMECMPTLKLLCNCITVISCWTPCSRVPSRVYGCPIYGGSLRFMSLILPGMKNICSSDRKFRDVYIPHHSMNISTVSCAGRTSCE